jgi:hypothetical protein
MLIAKLFLPFAFPGLAAIGVGALAVVTGPIQLIEVVAIVIGLGTVAVAGIFTIRSNVGKIWREQAEGEKARNLDLTADIAELKVERAEEKAVWTLREAELVASAVKMQGELDAALARSDQRPLVEKLDRLLAAAIPHAIEVTGEGGGPLRVEAKEP